MAEQNAGMKYEDFELFHVFICKSASDMKPEITYRYMVDGEADTTGSKNVLKNF